MNYFTLLQLIDFQYIDNVNVILMSLSIITCAMTLIYKVR